MAVVDEAMEVVLVLLDVVVVDQSWRIKISLLYTLWHGRLVENFLVGQTVIHLLVIGIFVFSKRVMSM